MTSTKRTLSSICPQCSSQVERFIINIDCEISMCESKDCSYPFNEQSAEGLNIETPNTSFIRYSKKNNKASSLSNTVALPTPDDNNNAKSAKKARTGSYKPASSSSEKKQKDQLHLTKSSDSNVSVEEVIVVGTSTDKSDLQINTLSQANTNKEQLATSLSELSSFTPPPEIDYQDLKSSVSSTASLSSTTTTTTTSPSTSSAMSIFDFSLPSPTNSIFNEALSNQSNHNITQKAPPPRKAVDPTTPPVLGLCLPPMAAAKIAKVPSNNSPTIADYTLSDIESLLTTDNVNPPSLQNQTEELSWMEDYNDLFM